MSTPPVYRRITMLERVVAPGLVGEVERLRAAVRIMRGALASYAGSRQINPVLSEHAQHALEDAWKVLQP